MNNVNLLLLQQRLLMRNAHLRASLSQNVKVLQTPLSLLDGTHAAIQWICKHPFYPVIAIGVVVLLKPRFALAWGQKLWGGWLTYQRMPQWLYGAPQ